MKIYAISGLGADKRVFDYLKLHWKLVHLDWIDPLPKESLQNYALRLSVAIDQSEKFIILGVSFGGLVAVEISKIIKPALTILVSSAEIRKEIPFVYRLAGKTHLMKFLPSAFFKPPKVLAYFLFGTDRKKLLGSIVEDADLKFAKWATLELINWKNRERLEKVVKIAGSNDRILAPGNSRDMIIIRGGHHFMIVDRAEEISKIINERISKI